MFLVVGGSLWELIYTEYISAPMGQETTYLPLLCPGANDYDEAYNAKQRSSWSTGLFAFVAYLLALEPCLLDTEAHDVKPIGKERPILSFLKSICASGYMVQLLCFGFLSFMVTLRILNDSMEKPNSGTIMTQSYFSYGVTYALMWTLGMCGLAMAYGYELFSKNGITSKKPLSRGPACFMLLGIQTVGFVSGVVCELIVLVVWLEAWLISDICYGLAISSLPTGVDIHTCDTWSDIYDVTLAALAVLTPPCIICTYLSVVRTWGTYCTTCTKAAAVDPDDSNVAKDDENETLVIAKE